MDDKQVGSGVDYLYHILTNKNDKKIALILPHTCTMLFLRRNKIF